MAFRRIQKSMPLAPAKDDTKESFMMPYDCTIVSVRAWLNEYTTGLGLSGLRWTVKVGERDVTGAFAPNTPNIGTEGVLEGLSIPVNKGDLVTIRKTGIAVSNRIAGTVQLEVII